MDSKTIKLSTGILQVMMLGESVVNEATLQVLMTKKIASSTSSTENRCRVMLSDGKFSITCCLLSPQMYNKFGGEIQLNSIVKITRYVANKTDHGGRSTRVLLILDLEMIKPGEEVDEGTIGTPTMLTDFSGNVSDSQDFTSTHNVEEDSEGVIKMEGSTKISPIISLCPFHNKWVIKVRVSNKSSIRNWSNSRGEGQLFHFDFMDETGEMRCTAFNELVDKFYDLIQIDQIYYITQCLLKDSNPQFNPFDSMYEMSLTSQSLIQRSRDQRGVPLIRYNFTPIERIATMEPNTLIDVIGVCKSVSEMQTFLSKNTNRELKKKDVVLVDQSQAAVSVTLWGNEAETFNGADSPVLALKRVRISEFAGGKNLNVSMNSSIKVNPKIKECLVLKTWFKNEGSRLEPKNISARAFVSQWMNFKELYNQNVNTLTSGYYQTVGTILTAKMENSLYKACPIDDCNKKVIDLENGLYKCEKCDREYNEFKYRLLLSISVSDAGGIHWCTVFCGEAEKILQKTSKEMGELKENNDEDFVEAFENAQFKRFLFKYRAKLDTYNDKQRVKVVITKVEAIPREEYNSHILEKIQKFIS